MKRIGKMLALAAFAALAAGGVAHAKQTVVWWDFLSGGDGVRMKAMIDAFNKSHPDIEIQATTLEWGVPFYTKVQTSAAVGQGPDVMTYHLSRVPLGVEQNVLRPFSDSDLALAGTKPDEYNPINWKGAHINGKLYAIPLDTHSIILYYNKDLLKKAGLLGSDGLPKGLDGLDNFNAALKKLTTDGHVGLSIPDDNGSAWRIFYTLLSQQGGKFLENGKILPGDNLAKATKAIQTVAEWVKSGEAPHMTEYPASIALFTSGKAAMHINGVWEVPTMVDLAKKGKLFDWGAIQIPTLFSQPATWADGHCFAIPNIAGKTMSPEKLKAVMTVIGWMNKHSIMWAAGGHVPAYLPVTESAEYKAMQPQATYASLTKTEVFDPQSTITGVASPTYDAAGNYILPGEQGDMAPADAASQMQQDLQGQL